MVSRSDTDETLESENIQGIRLRTFVKIKTPEQEPAVPEGGWKHMGGGSAFPTNPDRAVLESARKIIQTVRETRQPVRTNAIHEFSQIDLR